MIYLEKNATAYSEMLSQPTLADGNNTLEEFFSLSDDVGGGKLKRKILDMIGYREHAENAGQYPTDNDKHNGGGDDSSVVPLVSGYNTFYVASWGGCRSKMVVEWLKRVNPKAAVHHIHDPHPPAMLTFSDGEKFGTRKVPSGQRKRSVVIFLTREPWESISSRISRAHCNHIEADNCDLYVQTILHLFLIHSSQQLHTFITCGIKHNSIQYTQLMSSFN